MTDNHQIPDAQRLLLNAHVLYEKYEAGRPKPFNVFSMLALEYKEVELHSRFLAGLLDHRELDYKGTDGTDAKRQNLADFLERIGIKGFRQHTVRVEREKAHIDIRITNDSQQAVIIENKIHAWDQSQQLERYWEQTTKEGYRDVWLVYLTLDGREPTEGSLGNALKDEIDDKLKCISYWDHVTDWLLRCKQRACANPELRESIAQYLQTVRNITGINHSEEYMNKLSEYLLNNDPKGLTLARDLGDAFHKAMIDLQCKLWEKIADEVPRSIDPRFKNIDSNYWSSDKVRSWYEKKRKHEPWYGVFFSLGDDVWWEMGVEKHGDNLVYGVRDGFRLRHGIIRDEDIYKKLQDLLYKRLSSKDGMRHDPFWPCIIGVEMINFRYPSPEQLQYMAKKGLPDFLQECTQEIVDGLKQMWDVIIKETNLVT